MSYDEDIYKLPEKLNKHFEKMKKTRSDFLDSVGMMEINIKKVIGRYFISDFNRDWPVFSHMFSKVQLSFSDSIEILDVILKTPEMEKKFPDARRREWYKRMESVRTLRNGLAHNPLLNPKEEDLKKEQFVFFDFDSKKGIWIKKVITENQIRKVLKDWRTAMMDLRAIKDIVVKRH